MLLAECLALTPPDQLQRMARLAGLAPTAQRREVEETLLRRLSDPVRLARTVAELGPAEWQALKAVYWAGGEQGITVELCQQVVGAGGNRRRQGAQALSRLMDLGLIYTRKAGYREVYFIPAELLPLLGPLLTDRMARQVAVPSDPPVPDPGAPDLVEDLCRILAYVARQPVPVTQGGLIHKRHLRPLAALLDLEAPPGDDDAPAGRYPDPLGLLLEFARSQQLIAREEGALRPGPALAGWPQQDPGTVRAALFHFWLEKHQGPDVLAFLRLARAVGAGWIAVPLAAAELAPLLHPSLRERLEARLALHLTRYLAPLGAFALARDGEGRLRAWLTPAGQALVGAALDRLAGGQGAGAAGSPPPGAEAGAALGNPAQAGATAGPALDAPGGAAEAYRFILQPTGEVVAPRPVPLPVLWHLERVGRLTGRGPALTYRIDRESVYRALTLGLEGDAILAFLERHSATGVPQNLAFDIQAWAEAYGQVYFQEVCLLRCATPLLAAQIKAGRRTGRFVRGEVGPTALVVAREDYEALLQALLAEGLLPRPGIQPAL